MRAMIKQSNLQILGQRVSLELGCYVPALVIVTALVSGNFFFHLVCFNRRTMTNHRLTNILQGQCCLNSCLIRVLS